MYMFLDWVQGHLGFTLLPCLILVFRWVVNKARVFCVSFFFFGLGCHAYYCTPVLGTSDTDDFTYQQSIGVSHEAHTIAFTYQQNIGVSLYWEQIPIVAKTVSINVEIINCLGELFDDNQNYRDELKCMLDLFSLLVGISSRWIERLFHEWFSIIGFGS